MMHDPFAAMSSARPDATPAAAPLAWRGFLRALAEEIDAQRGEAARDELLRATGRRMALLLPLPDVASVEALALEMNEALGALGWGTVTLTLEESEKRLTILHTGLPRLGGAGEPPGMWLSAVLEGLYETWIAQQAGSDPHLVARRFASPAPGAVALRYGRG
jgi:hypothetical protein